MHALSSPWHTLVVARRYIDRCYFILYRPIFFKQFFLKNENPFFSCFGSHVFHVNLTIHFAIKIYCEICNRRKFPRVEFLWHINYIFLTIMSVWPCKIWQEEVCSDTYSIDHNLVKHVDNFFSKKSKKEPHIYAHGCSLLDRPFCFVMS
jgi:hypothetical protein